MRRLSIRWIGPIPYHKAFYRIKSGLFLVMCGQSMLLAGGANKVAHELGGHLSFGGSRMSPESLEGRDLLFYSRNYGTPLTAKLGVVHDRDAGDKEVTDDETLGDLVHMIIHMHHPPSNPYGRDRYLGKQALDVENFGKHYPLEKTMQIEPEVFELDDDEDL